LLTVAGMAGMPWIMRIVAPGFMAQPEKFLLTVAMAQVTFPYLLFMTLCAQFSGMLNSSGHFAAAAAAPVLLNLVLITVLMLVHLEGVDAGSFLAFGVTIAGALQFLFLALACRRAGILPHLPRPRLTPAVRRLLLLMGPGVLGAGVVQINVVVGDILASLLPQGSISWLYYADRINQLPLGIIGVAAGIALLPLMARQIRAGQAEAANHSMNRTLEIALFLTVPAAAALLAMPDLVVAALYQRGAFGDADTRAVAGALQAFALGLPAYVLIKALAPGFFARQDTRTPVIIAMVNVALNLLLALVLMRYLAHVGIALAAAVTAWINAGLLALVLHRRRHYRSDRLFRRNALRLLLCAAMMGAALWGAQTAVMARDALAAPLPRTLLLLVMVAGGALLYLALSRLFGVIRFRELWRMLRPARRD